jgi:glycosyltransferase involved in cell wall biosynthesis
LKARLLTFVAMQHSNEIKKGGLRKGPENPLVSVITVCFNASSSLTATIDSLSKQTSSNYEFIIIDGGSTDATLELLQKHNNLIDKWISGPDQGIYDAMNKGAALARGTYLAFLNADDSYLTDTIAQVEKYLQYSQPAVLHGNIIKIREIDKQIYEREEQPQPELMPQGMGIFHPATFVKKEAFVAAGGYDRSYQLAADYALFLHLWQSGFSFEHLDGPLAYFSLGGASNDGCGTYAEAVDIQKKYNTGYASQTQKLFWKCRRKKALRQFIFGMARLTGTQRWINRVIQKRWA